MTAQSPGPDAVARDEVGEAAIHPQACVFCNLPQWERHPNADVLNIEPLDPVVPGHRILIPRQHVERADTSPVVTALTFEHAAAWAKGQGGDFNLIVNAGRAATQSVDHLHVHYVPRREDDGLTLPWTGQNTPHLTPQPDGDVREADEWLAITLAARIVKALSWDHPDAERDALHVARTVLASGLVVPVGRRDRAEAQVAAVRRELERWDGYGHGEFNIHMPENLPCSACNLMAAIRAEIRAALDTAPASPTTDQRIEARQLTGERDASDGDRDE